MATQTPEQLRDLLGLPRIDQIGFVVPDIKQAMASYEALFGPWSSMEAEVESANHRGEIHDASLLLAFGASGDLEFLQMP